MSNRLLIAGGIMVVLVFGFVAGRACSPPTQNVGATQATFTCSMHPQVRADQPGDCPVCGMALIPLSSADVGGTLTLSKRAQTLAAIRTAPVQRLGADGVARRLLGRVDYDESSYRTVTSWVGGRIDRLQVKTTGAKVRAGQPIATLYSPEVFTAHQDLLVAKRQLEQLGSASETASSAGRAALSAARDRLRLLGVPEREIRTMETASKPSEQVRIRSPFSGTVIERLATEGAYVKTGSGLYRIANLDRLWVQLDAYESDLRSLAPGQAVELRVDAIPDQTFDGSVTFVDPVLDKNTRTARVRIEVKNADGQLRPGMFAEAIVRADKTPGPKSLMIPASAPLFTGRRSIVYVETTQGDRATYKPKEVRLGPRVGEHYPVLSGLSEGERVVVHGAFALDADLQIRGGPSMMNRDDDDSAPAVHTVAVPGAAKGKLAEVVLRYLDVHHALASDDLPGAKSAADALGKAGGEVPLAEPKEFAGAWSPVARHLADAVATVSTAATLEAARTGFHQLSLEIATVLRVFGNPTEETLRLASCPMALENRGAEWVQRSEKIENPYFGASMHRCGSINEAVEHGTYLPTTSKAHEGHAH